MSGLNGDFSSGDGLGDVESGRVDDLSRTASQRGSLDLGCLVGVGGLRSSSRADGCLVVLAKRFCAMYRQ